VRILCKGKLKLQHDYYVENWVKNVLFYYSIPKWIRKIYILKLVLLHTTLIWVCGLRARSVRKQGVIT